MKSKDYFFLVFFLTILITRIFLFIKPISSPAIFGFRLHHYMYGLVFILVAFLIRNLTLYALGLGLFVDELMFVLIRGDSHEANYSPISLIGLLIFIILVFFIRKQLIPNKYFKVQSYLE